TSLRPQDSPGCCSASDRDAPLSSDVHAERLRIHDGTAPGVDWWEDSVRHSIESAAVLQCTPSRNTASRLQSFHHRKASRYSDDSRTRVSAVRCESGAGSRPYPTRV